GRVRAVVEDVPEVAATASTHHLGAPHEQAVVGADLHLVVRHGVPEARPSSAGVELGVGAEQLLAASSAAIGPARLLIPVGAGECTLRALVAKDVVLLRRQLRSPLGV